ncbi:MAG: cysteine--tRNA ligase [Bacteroidetes bacterium]|jgi:cysteinyl-tRNA synthetase|nr:cysteine--tRNA ligase [Sphingobacteriales bacterium]MBP9142607.1 cysteine--tRNA ligase [Chitinophagales bacterium]MDA0198552.1 cysteine--tRNA ligase [Bacteroidota bacterium]HMS52623.1 cysteine--tRNA ligase [Chitinophagales bacterium]
MRNTELTIYNTLSGQKEKFAPLKAGFVGMYVCGPTVYNYVHLGNCRTFVFFDVLYRYLKHIGYKVRFVRNITDVGHLENEAADSGEDRIGKKARLEQLEPMEVVQKYSNNFHDVMDLLNVSRPSIEPTASGHIPEQIAMVQQIIDNGFAYEAKGSVYFDVPKYAEYLKSHPDKPMYGQLSGKILEDLIAGSRDLDGQDDKKSPTDFAIWIKQPVEHIMRWKSPWGEGTPGWHLECSVMSQKYLGEVFDIHGGGMDLKFPHHEAEIAQSIGCCGNSPVQYWMHSNMLTVNGTKMSKSLGNSFLPAELFAGDHPVLEQAYSPMTLRCFFMTAHYRSTVDFTNKGLQDAEKGYKRLMESLRLLDGLKHPGNEIATNIEADLAARQICADCYTHINDDFNTARVLADLYEIASIINRLHNQQLPLDALAQNTFEELANTYRAFLLDVLGLKDETAAASTSSKNASLTNGLMDLVLQIRAEARARKDWATSDIIRNKLAELQITVKDGKDGTTWTS